MARITIEDISRQTGLSRGTVSRALNDRPDISRQTKQRVLEACRKLNYLPSHAARSLATGRSFAVAVLVDDLHSVFAASFLRGVLSRAQPAGYAVNVGELNADPEQQQETIQALVGERIDGVLLGTALTGVLAPVLQAALEDRPLVAGAVVEGFACDLLVPDQAEAGRLVARHLLQNSVSELLYVHVSGSAADERLAGFQEVCRQHELDAEAITVELPGDRPINSAIAELVAPRLSGVRAIAATDDFLAIDIMSLCCQAGRLPGRDVAVIGQGNEYVSARITPSLSTVDFCGEEIGRRAMETALQRLGKTRMDAPQAAQISPLLVARESSRTLT